MKIIINSLINKYIYIYIYILNIISEIRGEVRLSVSPRIVPGEGFHCSNYKYQVLAINFHSTANYNIYNTSTTTTRLQQHNSREEHASYPPEVPVPWRWSDLLGMQLHYAVEAVHELAHLDGKRRTYQSRREYVFDGVGRPYWVGSCTTMLKLFSIFMFQYRALLKHELF